MRFAREEDEGASTTFFSLVLLRRGKPAKLAFQGLGDGGRADDFFGAAASSERVSRIVESDSSSSSSSSPVGRWCAAESAFASRGE